MWLIYLTFGLALLLIWWSYSGYLIWLYLVGAPRPESRAETDEEQLPDCTVIVCCRNERELIAGKIRNLGEMRYPRHKLRVLIVDGGSTDGTPALAEEAARNTGLDGVVEVHRSDRAGKINQLNLALDLVRTDIVIVTDADVLVSPDVLVGMVAELVSDDSIGVIGALSQPANCSAEESAFWDSQNRIRLLESNAFSSSIVVAPCYAFRRRLMPRFPDDVVADDVCVSLMATTHGYRTIYRPDLKAVELRASKTTPEFCRHKFRKSHAYCLEALRFLCRLPWMEGRFKVIFLTRVLHLFGTPPLLIFLLLNGLALVEAGGLWAAGSAALGMLVSLAITRHILGHLPLGARQHSLLTVMKVFVLANLVLLAVALAFPFHRQNSQYSRLTLGRAMKEAPGESASQAKPGEKVGAIPA